MGIELGFMGPNYSVSTACATANYAFVNAANHIRNGEADLIIAGGSEAAIMPVGLGGFVACRSALYWLIVRSRRTANFPAGWAVTRALRPGHSELLLHCKYMLVMSLQVSPLFAHSCITQYCQPPCRLGSDQGTTIRAL